MDKTAIKNFAIEARKILMRSAITEAGFYGITKDGCQSPVQKGKDFEVYETVAGTENRIFGDNIKRRANLVTAIKEQGFDQVIEETAYTWFNRIIAIRFMEVNNYLPTRVRVLSSETGSTTPDIVTQSDTVELNLSSEELEKIQTAKRENRYDDAFRSLFIKQCNELNAILPGLFEKTDDYMELLLKITYTGDGVIRMLVDSIPEDNFNVETEGQVEIIGWMYQYYISEKHEQVVDPLYGKAISKEDVPAATQLFTTDWVVRYLVDNSLGRYWMERNPNSMVIDDLEFLTDYHVRDNENITVEELKVFDPCMGSAHFLVYAFDVLMKIYREEGYTDRDAAVSILEHNIYGVDIDDRAYQMAYIALMMKARQYNRLIFRKNLKCKVFSIKETNQIDKNQVIKICESVSENAYQVQNDLLYLVDLFRDAKEYGSLIEVEQRNWENCRNVIETHEIDGQLTLDSIGMEQTKKLLLTVIDIAEVLSNKYHAVVTNPPYLNKFDDKLKTFLFERYKDYAGDLFSVFMVRNFMFCTREGYSAFMTPNVWMFIVSYEKLRDFIIDTKHITSLIQMAKGAFFKEATVDVAAFVLCNSEKDEVGTYYRLEKFKGDMDVQYDAMKRALVGEDVTFVYHPNQKGFHCIQGSPIAYWTSDAVLKVFKNSEYMVSAYAQSEGKNVTTKNAKYILYYWEVDWNNVGAFDKKWLPCATGGDYRKWYGNVINVIDWSPETRAFYKKAPAGRIIREEFWTMPGVTWGKISSAASSFRFLESQQMYQETAILQRNQDDSKFVLALLNSSSSSVFLEFLSPTVNFQLQDICSIPVPFMKAEMKKRIIELSELCIKIAKDDWDSYEVSMDFKRHPLINGGDSVERAFKEWEMTCDERIEKLIAVEEEINTLIAEAYGLQDEIDCRVLDKAVSVKRADRKREIKSLLSYFVGCLMGRYSLDQPGIVYAGGDINILTIDNSNDGLVLLTDEDYSLGDIASLFVDWIKKAYGTDKYNENMSFIASTLSSSNKKPEEIVRDYFVSEFYKDHVKMFQKRPIYWMFDAGKYNGFKLLSYLHKFNEDTVGKIRTDYLSKVQYTIENAYKNAEYIIQTSTSSVDKASATKKKDKYVKQMAEIKTYYPALSHIALQRTVLDLDCGVKVNYSLFQGIEVSIEGEKKQKVDLLAKI